jgi:hypothetical protein
MFTEIIYNKPNVKSWPTTILKALKSQGTEQFYSFPVTQVVKKSTAVYGTSATGPYPEPDEFNPHPHISFI